MANRFPLIANTTASQIQELASGDFLDLSESGIANSGNITVVGYVNATNLTGTLTTAAQPNITSVGSLGSLTVIGNVSSGNVSGTTGTFTNVAGTLTTAAQPNITSVGSLGSLAVTGNINSGNIIATGSVQGSNIDSVNADLAEKYLSDSDYKSGTVVVFGGINEITQSTNYADPRVAGVISTKPAYCMNVESGGLPVALQGRVPCRVTGNISKGDLITASNIPGVATRLDPKDWIPGSVIGKALIEHNSDSEGLIEVVVGRV